jgi:hypothetical protein
MSREVETRVPPESAIRNYMVVCLVALGVVLAALMYILEPDGLTHWAALPVALGAVSVVFRWRIGPVLLLVTLGSLFYVDKTVQVFYVLWPSSEERSPLAVWVLSGGVLGYCAAHYRLLGLTSALLPSDPRRFAELVAGSGNPATTRGVVAGFPDPPATDRRPPALVPVARPVSAWEIGSLMLALPIWAFLAQLAERLLPNEASHPHELSKELLQGVVLAWALTLGTLVGTGFLSYLGRQMMTRRQAMIYLQDVLWRETRRDQRRIQRWLVWRKLRRRRKELS